MFGMTDNENTNVDAIQLLKRDHDDVDKMFKEYEEIKERADDSEKEALVAQICDALTVHAQIEEEIFYPALRAVFKDTDLLAEAEVEHQTAKDLIAQIEGMGEADEMFDAKVKVLGEYIDHHVKEEQNEIFPQAKKAKVDMNALGEKMMERKQELLEEMGLLDDDEVDEDEDDGAGSERQRATETK